MRKLPSENGLKKGPWTEEEDLKLIQYVQTHGPGKWRNLPKNAGLLRCGKSCRLRWTNYLRPDIKRGRFSFEEEETIIQLHSVLGNKWSTIATHLPGRTDNEIKNYWNTHIRKRLIQNGIDPVTHTPRVDFLKVSSILNSARFNLSNLLNLQTLVNPQILTLAALLASTSHNENRQLFLNKHINSIMPNPDQQNPDLTSPLNLQSAHQFLTQADDNQYFPGNLANVNGDGGEDYLISTCLTDNCLTIPNYSNQSAQVHDQKANFEPLYTKNIVLHKYDPVLSSPMSSPTPLISSSTFINNSSTEDEGESYCGSLFKLGIQENFEFNDLM